MDLLSDEIQAIVVKTWFWKSEYKNPQTSMFSLKNYDYKDFNTLGLVILTSPKNSDYGKLIIAEECKMDDSADRIVYRLQVILTYIEKEKQHSIETEFIKRKDEKFCIYYIEDIKIRELMKIMCTFSEPETSFKTGERNVNMEPKENNGASNQRTPTITRNIMDSWRSLTSTLSKELYRGFLNEMEKTVVLNVRDLRLTASKVAAESSFSTLKVIEETETNRFLIIADCNPDIFKLFLLYLCTGKVNSMSKENTFDLYFLAKRYNLKLLESECNHRIQMYCPNC